MMDFFPRYLDVIARKACDVDPELLQETCVLVQRAARRGGKVVLIGNGGSAAIASHIAVDLANSAGIRAICFNEASLITCLANDYGHEQWMAKAIEMYADAGDVVVLISSSGGSANIVNAARQAKSAGIDIVTFSGFFATNPLRRMGNVNLWADSDTYNIVETVHTMWLAAVVDCLALEMRQLPSAEDALTGAMTEGTLRRVKMEKAAL